RGDAHNLAADIDQIQRLLHAGGGVHRIAGEHGLDDYWLIAADDHAAVGGISDDHRASVAPAIKKRRLAILKGGHFSAAPVPGVCGAGANSCLGSNLISA